MKRKNENLEKNISRLVKLSSDKDTPSDQFTQSLIDDALNELQQKAPARQREGRIVNMKLTLKTLAAAAVFIAALGIVALLPTLNKVKQHSSSAQFATATKDDSVKQAVEADRKANAPAKIQYEQKGVKLKEEIASITPASIPAPTEHLKVAAKKKYQPGMMGPMGQMGPMGMTGSNTFAPMMMQAQVGKSRRIRGTRNLESLGYAGGRSALYDLNMTHPMAHGGTTPPNGEDVDAMFFKNYGVNPFVDTEDDHLSTFATDVDTGSYTLARSYLHDGNLPPSDAVRVEEFVNYFDYGYAPPHENDFAVYTEAVPWQFGKARKNSHLMRIGLKAKQISDENRKPAVLTFVIDVSGSMGREDRLGLVKKSLRLLVDNLKPTDKIGIAVYGSTGRMVMDHKSLSEKNAIISAIESLYTEGATNAEEGIRIGYDMADKAYTQGSINRVILCSDGVANVGRTGADDIFKMIEDKAEKGITLSAIGFGMGNYNDVMMEQLGDKGNGYYAYVDTFSEASRLFGEDLTGTLQVVARDVKIQVDFNPDVVRSYRLIGYENRDVADDKFRDDKQDGGEIGAGHAATALYEIKLWDGKQGNVATIYVRYKDAEAKTVTEFKSAFDTKQIKNSFGEVTGSFALASTVTEFAEILRKSYWAKDANLNDVLAKAQKLSAETKSGKDVIELIDLISKSKHLMGTDDLKPQPQETIIIERLEK